MYAERIRTRISIVTCHFTAISRPSCVALGLARLHIYGTMLLRVSCILMKLVCVVALVATFSSRSMAETHGTGAGGRSTYSAESGAGANPCDVTRPVASTSIPSVGSLYGETSPSTACYSLACCPEDRVPAVCSPTPPDCSGRVCAKGNPIPQVQPGK